MAENLHNQCCIVMITMCTSMDCMLIFRCSAEKPEPPAVDITEFEWIKREGEVMPFLDATPVAPPALLAIISCGCKAVLKPTTKCSCAAEGLACTSYCYRKGHERI